MCGILAILGKNWLSVTKNRLDSISSLLRHRGPDSKGSVSFPNAFLFHSRLAIVDLQRGQQPMIGRRQVTALVANSEIYNHNDVRLRLNLDGIDHFKTQSDSETILHGIDELRNRKLIPSFLNALDGMFAFVHVGPKHACIARDPIGILPLYYGVGPYGTMWFASEMKALINECREIKQFPPGHYIDVPLKDKFSHDDIKPKPFFLPDWRNHETNFLQKPYAAEKLRKVLTRAVESHLMSDVPVGVLLSGGLDSSLIAAIAAKKMANQKLETFSVGFEPNSTDLDAAQIASNYIGTSHHPLFFPLESGLDAIEAVIYHTETYDVTTIRASIPMFLLAKYIQMTGIKVVLSGEGSDEIFGGYLYFHRAPSPKEFHDELVRKIERLHLYDCLRANKSMAAFGVELRVPFLQKDVINHVMNIQPSEKMCNADKMEKWILRNAFKGTDYLPDEILWRQKEQFSDGVGYGWIKALKNHAENEVSDSAFAAREHRFTFNTPSTKEAYYYRDVFETLFCGPDDSAAATVPCSNLSVACSTAESFSWMTGDSSMIIDPSGRSLFDHKKSCMTQEDEDNDSENDNSLN